MVAQVAPDGQVPEAVLRRVNGEHKHTNAHARDIKSRGDDTSIDEVWEVDPKLAFNDSYVMFTTKMYLFPKLALLWLPTFLLTLPYASIAHTYGSCLPVPTDHVRRGAGFHACLLVARLLLIPTFVLGLVSLVLDYVFYYLFGGVFFVLFGSMKQYKASQKVIAPYRGGQILFSDIFVSSMGQCLRNGTMEHALSFTTMLTVMPWVKYYINANPLIYPLKERFVQQISTSWHDLGPDVAHEKVREIISRSRQEGRLAKRMDMWRFCPHYPYPPPGRRWANGLQAGNIFTLLTHVTHAVAEAQGVTDQFVLSNCTERPVWRVMLWYSNPYHFLSGWVEASITNGEPSQKDKVHGGEHPMWLVTAPSPLLSNRDSVTGPGVIDTFFDSWLPVIANEVRRLARGAEYAASMHQEVVSKDGLSRPACAVGMEKLSEDAKKIEAHRELRAAAKKSKMARLLKKALAASVAFSADTGPAAAATESESSTPGAPHPD